MSLFERVVRWSTTYRIASHCIFWGLVFIVTLTDTDPAYDEVNHFTNELIKTAFFVFFYMLPSYFVAYMVIPKLMKHQNYLLTILYFLAGSYLITAFLRLVTVHILEPLVRKPPFEQEEVVEILIDIKWLATHYFIHFFSVAWIFGFFKLIKDQYLAQQRALLLEKEKTETELNILKAQLNPHFLFNTLNNIYSLSLINSPVISKSITELSEILDHVLNRCKDTYVPISTEIALLDNYIGLEKLRYNERLQVNFEHQIDNDRPIAPLILLSLTENAFKHGASEDIGNPMINLKLNLTGNLFSFSIANTFASHLQQEKPERIGLSNIRKQLDLIYGQNYSLDIIADETFFTVLLTIKLEEQSSLT